MMPQGPSHWHEFWKGDERPARYLRARGFVFRQGAITDGPLVDALDMAAILYLIQEWDYAYEPNEATLLARRT